MALFSTLRGRGRMAEKNNGFVPGFAGMRGLKHVREKYLRTSMIR